MKKLIITVAAFILLVFFTGCAGEHTINKDQPAEDKSPQTVEVATAQGEPKELEFELSFPDKYGEHKYLRHNAAYEFSLAEEQGAILWFQRGTKLEDLQNHIKPNNEAVTIEELADRPDGQAKYEVRIDASLLEKDKKVVIQKGLKSEDESYILMQDIVLDFGLPEWKVSLQRVSETNGEEFFNSMLTSSFSMKVRLSFDDPADRKSVEESITKNIFFEQSLDSSGKRIKEPGISYDWESDSLCYVTVTGMEVGGFYEINLMDAHAQNGARILNDHSYIQMNGAYPKESTQKERSINFTYYFQCRDKQKITALNLMNATEREVQSLDDVFGSVGPVSPNGRFVVVSPYSFSFDYLASTYNLAVFDRETGITTYSPSVFADTLDEISVDDNGKLLRGKGFDKTSLPQKLTAYQLLSICPNSRITAVEKNSVIELYDASWKKIGELDVKTLGGAEVGRANFHEAVSLFWGEDKLCIVYSKGNAQREACLWEYRANKIVTAAIPYGNDNLAPLYFDNDTQELLYVKDAYQMQKTTPYGEAYT